ncbi:30S ribosomal protein S9 [Pigmentibacter ruber]|uniref:30S ribosomal protein S9 n=1 Tax=Pigmentibacter TaxID=2838409 RepID=UPI00131BCA1B|nr:MULTISPECIES: 30S ribosomal protein S9 [Pigmentibacter]WGL58760.1 30S ribosomal protein S9 [Pigmentibacter sp. JX0631]BFD33300.1 30S ribosomal protein S9 [Pigmentibacter ruber]
MAVKYISGVGKRKTSIARVYLVKDGKGTITINHRSLEDYFKRPTSRMVVEQPLNLTQTLGKVDINVRVIGGGLSGQAGAIRHGITNALLNLNPEFRSILKPASLITRDDRIKERKKYGLRSARARFQFSKR